MSNSPGGLKSVDQSLGTLFGQIEGAWQLRTTPIIFFMSDTAGDVCNERILRSRTVAKKKGLDAVASTSPSAAAWCQGLAL